jgi:hypothetical protein
MMTRKILSFLIPLMLVASVASANWLGDLLRADIDPKQDNVEIKNNLVQASTTVTSAGPTDDLDLDDVNVVFIDTSSNNVTLGGVKNTDEGQVIHFVIIDATNNATIEHAESTGNQDFYTFDGSDQATSTSYGGWTFVSNGTHLYEIQDD